MRLLLWDLGNRFSSLCCQKSSCVAWDKLLLCPSILIQSAEQQQQLSITGVIRDVRLDVAREVLMWGTELPSAGSDTAQVKK